MFGLQQCPATFYDGLCGVHVVCMLVCGHRLSRSSTTSDITLSSMNAHPCGIHAASETSKVLLLRDNAGHSALCPTQRPSPYRNWLELFETFGRKGVYRRPEVEL